MIIFDHLVFIRDLSEQTDLECSILNCFMSPSNEVKSAAAFALGMYSSLLTRSATCLIFFNLLPLFCRKYCIGKTWQVHAFLTQRDRGFTEKAVSFTSFFKRGLHHYFHSIMTIQKCHSCLMVISLLYIGCGCSRHLIQARSDGNPRIFRLKKYASCHCSCWPPYNWLK